MTGRELKIPREGEIFSVQPRIRLSRSLDQRFQSYLGYPLRINAALDVCRARGHRRLVATTCSKKCRTCIWGREMAVEMIIEQRNPSVRRYRLETFCYGPKSCPLYKPEPTRKVPGRNGMSWEEEDWGDAEATARRAPNE